MQNEEREGKNSTDNDTNIDSLQKARGGTVFIAMPDTLSVTPPQGFKNGLGRFELNLPRALSTVNQPQFKIYWHIFLGRKEGRN